MRRKVAIAMIASLMLAGCESVKNFMARDLDYFTGLTVLCYRIYGKISS